MDDFWQISGKLGGKLGDIHSSPGRERKTKTLVGEGVSSLAILVVPGLRSLPKLDVAGSTPAARSTGLRQWAASSPRDVIRQRLITTVR